MRSTCIAACIWWFCVSASAAEDAITPVAAARVAEVAAPAESADVRAPHGDEKAQPKPDAGPKALSGMSILGNQDAPKALVIVPWKSSQLGDPQGISKQLDDGRQPVDRDVFMRELSYYEIRIGAK